MESGAKGCEVIVTRKLRAARAKSMKFKNGYMVCSGQPVKHVLLRQIGEVPKLTSGCSEFINSAENILEKRRRTKLSILLDMLQILQLMDTWVDNGNFDEVLATMHPKIACYLSTCSGG